MEAGETKQTGRNKAGGEDPEETILSLRIQVGGCNLARRTDRIALHPDDRGDVMRESRIAVDIEADKRKENELKRAGERRKAFKAKDWDRKVQAVVDWAESKNEGTAQASAEEGPNQTNQD